MNFHLQIAKRYLFSKKSINVINIISLLSVLGMAVGTTALIVVLSAFNGINQFIGGMLSSFDADLKISLVEGKSFQEKQEKLEALKQIEGVVSYMGVVEDNVLVAYGSRQKYASLKGVPDEYTQFSGIDSMMVVGDFKLQDEKRQHAILGYGVAMNLGVGMNMRSPIHLYYPKRNSKRTIALQNAFNHDYISPGGFFSIQQEIDEQYVLVPINFARQLLQLEGKLSSVELKLTPNADVEQVKAEVLALMGSEFKVQDRMEQHALIYQVMKSEKWASFLILGFILLIASFNLLGSLTMIILDKKNDIYVLRSMGADSSFIRHIFMVEGWMISLLGAIIGIAFGVLLVWVQMKFALVKLPGDGSFAISAYPMQLQWIDIIATLGIVFAIGLFVSWIPTRNLENEASIHNA
ncbi:MAG: ABC transporter permease [Mangrovibacterium sp.]